MNYNLTKPEQTLNWMAMAGWKMLCIISEHVWGWVFILCIIRGLTEYFLFPFMSVPERYVSNHIIENFKSEDTFL